MVRDGAALFLDRDGTLMTDVGYPSDPDQVRLLPGVLPAMARLHEVGFALVVVSNQSGIGRGIISADQARAVHDRLVVELRAGGVELEGAYYCPHSPTDGCGCRKPSPALVFKAAGDLGLDLTASFFVGDKPSDLETGRRAGCRTAGIGNAFPPGLAGERDLVADNWECLAEAILVAGERLP